MLFMNYHQVIPVTSLSILNLYMEHAHSSLFLLMHLSHFLMQITTYLYFWLPLIISLSHLSLISSLNLPNPQNILYLISMYLYVCPFNLLSNKILNDYVNLPHSYELLLSYGSMLLSTSLTTSPLDYSRISLLPPLRIYPYSCLPLSINCFF